MTDWQSTWTTEFFQRHASQALDHARREFENSLLIAFERAVKQCESPLEAAFSAWWVALARLESWPLLLAHQQEVTTLDGRRFRLDLAIAIDYHDLYREIPPEERPKIAIELDGHEFHERTRDQVTSRNVRDRALDAAGWKVWHVSGSEFHRDPQRVVRELFHRADTLFSNVY
jgi:very-short-patch-repair endonuclease